MVNLSRKAKLFLRRITAVPVTPKAGSKLGKRIAGRFGCGLILRCGLLLCCLPLVSWHQGEELLELCLQSQKRRHMYCFFRFPDALLARHFQSTELGTKAVVLHLQYSEELGKSSTPANCGRIFDCRKGTWAALMELSENSRNILFLSPPRFAGLRTDS